MGFRKITVVNNRQSNSNNSIYTKVAFMSCGMNENDCIECNCMIPKGATKDIYIPLPKRSPSGSNPFSQWVIMRTNSKSAEPTVNSEYCSVVGNAISGTVRYTILLVAEESPNEFSIIVKNG